jgi:LysR family transcriptional activator of nhaA
MQDINMNSLFYFFEIAKAGSLKQAAIKLHLTQPTLSHQLKTLEHNLGVMLFDRIGKRLQLNNDGKLVLEHCYKIFAQLQEMKNNIDLKRERPTNQLNIGALPSMSKLSVYKSIAEYIRDQTIKVTIKEENIKYLLPELENKDLDIIFTDFQVHNYPKSIIQKKLYSRDFIAVCNPQCKLKRKPFPFNLEGLPFINYTQETPLHDKINNYLKKQGVVVQNYTEVDDTSLIKEILLNQNFAAIIPKVAVQREIKEKKLKKLGDVLQIKSDIYILINDDNSNPIIKMFTQEQL